MTNPIYIVGAGPGAPDLITVRGKNLLDEADHIYYTDSLVPEELLENCKTSARKIRTSGLILEEIVDKMVEAWKEELRVVRLHTGDPAVFGAVSEQLVMLRKRSVPFEIVPGVSSAFASAARLGIELTVPELTQTIILTRAEGRTPVPDREKLVDLARHHATTALFLSAGLVHDVVDAFLFAGWAKNSPVAIIQRATWPDEKIVMSTLETMADAMASAKIKSHAMIIVGEALGLVNSTETQWRSRLYHPEFSHGYRTGSGGDSD